MHNLDDNELDRLSRDAAERYEPEAAPPAWESLQKRLDREMPTRREGRDRKYLLLLLLLLLVGGGSALLYNSRNQNLEAGSGALTRPKAGNDTANTSASREAANPADATSDATTDASTEAKNGTNEEASASRDRNTQASKDNLDHGKAVNDKETFANTKQPQFNKGRSNDLSTANTGKGNKTGVVAGSGLGIAANKTRNRSGQSGGSTKLDNSNSGDLDVSTDVSFFHVSELNTEKKDFSFARLNETNPKLNGSAPITTYATTTRDRKTTDNQFRPFEIGIVVGPDRSQVHSTKGDQSGYNIGLTLGYNLSRRWQINTGLMYNRKYYNAKGEDYHAPKGYWTDTLYLSMVNGSCNMWDLPINVRYNIVAKKNYSVFASAGISTYFMKTEDYGYHYYDRWGQYGYKYKSTPTNDAYWFSIGNLSAGYEQNFGSFSVQAEPYLKFALRGVGLGSVDLNSYGMNIGLKYKPKWSLKKANPQTK